MSNVLIGIIGVILFIGLALAGALFLGEEFQKASQRNKAMVLAQMAAQISAAASLSETETGREIAAKSSVTNLLMSGYLRTLPLNPYIEEGGYPFRVLYSGDLMSSGAGLADVVFVSMGPSEGARDVCRTLNRQAGGGEVIQELVMAYGTDMRSIMQRNGGCFRMHDVGIPGEAGAHDYVTYAKI